MIIGRQTCWEWKPSVQRFRHGPYRWAAFFGYWMILWGKK